MRATYTTKKEDTAIVKQAYLYELTRPIGCVTFMNSINKNIEPLHSLHTEFLPYKNPYENIFGIPDAKLTSYTRHIFHNDWKTKLEASTKGETYKSFKEVMKFEPYLKHLNRKHRVILSKLRTSDHKLMIEEGRRIRPKIPRESRTCKICPTEIENEQHLLVDCKLYGSRPELFKLIEDTYPAFTRLDSRQKFLYLMTQENQDITTAIVSKIDDWLSLRDLLHTYFFQP